MVLPIDGQNGFPGQAGAIGPRGFPGVPGCNGSKVKRKKTFLCNKYRTSLYAYFTSYTQKDGWRFSFFFPFCFLFS